MLSLHTEECGRAKGLWADKDTAGGFREAYLAREGREDAEFSGVHAMKDCY